MIEAVSMQKPLQINDLFWTVQGEGRWSGYRALFVRMPYCNYDCPWCDTEYNSFRSFSEEEFLSFCEQEPARLAVLTGGEPTLHKDTSRIIQLLKKHNFYIACETNGSAPIPEGIDFPTVSPKLFTKNKFPPYYVHEDVYGKVKEWKYVVDSNFDFNILARHQPQQLKKDSLPAKPTEKHIGQYTEICYSLSPEFSDMTNNTKKILDYISENPIWRLSLQTHKWIHIP